MGGSGVPPAGATRCRDSALSLHPPCSQAHTPAQQGVCSLPCRDAEPRARRDFERSVSGVLCEVAASSCSHLTGRRACRVRSRHSNCSLADAPDSGLRFLAAPQPHLVSSESPRKFWRACLSPPRGRWRASFGLLKLNHFFSFVLKYFIPDVFLSKISLF